MNLKFNVVTWYSKLLSIIFFIAVLPILTFYIGTQYQLTVNSQNGEVVVATTPSVILKKEKVTPKIDVDPVALEGEVFGKIQDVYEKDGKLWVNIDPADRVSALECVFRAYDASLSQNCEAPDGIVDWNISTSTISMPLSEKAVLAVYYNDGTKIGLKPRVINSKNGKLYSFVLNAKASIVNANTNTSVATTTDTPTPPTVLSLSDIAKKYNRILSYDGDDTYRWNPPMYIQIKAKKTDAIDSSSVGTGKISEVSSTISEVTSVEEVWRP